MSHREVYFQINYYKVQGTKFCWFPECCQSGNGVEFSFSAFQQNKTKCEISYLNSLIYDLKSFFVDIQKTESNIVCRIEIEKKKKKSLT